MTLIRLHQIIMQIVQAQLPIHRADEQVLAVRGELYRRYRLGAAAVCHHCFDARGFVEVPETHVAIVS